MKLTSKKLKQMIREAMGSIDMTMDKKTVKYDDLSSDAIATMEAVQSLNDERIKIDNNGIYYSERVTPPIIIVWAGPRGSEPSHSNVLATINSRGGMSVVRNIRHLDLVGKLSALTKDM